MRILFIGSGCSCRLPFVEQLFKKKLQEAEIQDIEVETADMETWGVTSQMNDGQEKSGPDKVGNLLGRADFIVVMEGRQRNFLTRFMDYANWHKIHLFPDYCTMKRNEEDRSGYGYFNYRSQEDEMNEGCRNLLARVKAFLKEHLGEKTDLTGVVTV